MKNRLIHALRQLRLRWRPLHAKAPKAWTVTVPAPRAPASPSGDGASEPQPWPEPAWA